MTFERHLLQYVCVVGGAQTTQHNIACTRTLTQRVHRQVYACLFISPRRIPHPYSSFIFASGCPDPTMGSLSLSQANLHRPSPFSVLVQSSSSYSRSLRCRGPRKSLRSMPSTGMTAPRVKRGSRKWVSPWSLASRSWRTFIPSLLYKFATYLSLDVNQFKFVVRIIHLTGLNV